MTGHLPTAGDPLALGGLETLADEFRRIAREEALRAVREAIRDAPGAHPIEMTIACWARRRGCGYSTARRWAKAALLAPAPSGKYRTAELDTLPRAPTAPPSPVHDLAAERARRVAERVLRPKGSQ